MKFGIIGTNFISDRFIEASKKVEGAEICAVYSRGKDTADAFSKKHGIEKKYTVYTDMLQDPDIDAVYVASPTMCHAEQSILALRHGKAVLCEKMICVSLDEFLSLKAEKERVGGTVIEALRCDFDPPIIALRSLLPKIGKIRRAHFEYCQYSSRYDAFKRGEVMNAFKPEMKNSALADIGIYPLHLCISLFDTPHALTSKSVFLDNGFEGAGEVTLDYKDMLATVSYSKITEGSSPSVIEGEAGSLIIDRVNGTGKVILVLRGEEPIVIPTEWSPNNMEYEIREFIKIADGKSDGDVYFAYSEKTMRCVDEIYRQSGIKF